MISVNDRIREPIEIGVQGENKAREIKFDYSAWAEAYGDGSVMVTVDRAGAAYEAANYEAADGICTWIPDSTDTAVDGFGMVELSYIADDVVAKTVVFKTITLPGIGEGEAPEPYENILERIHEEVVAAEEAVDDVQESAARAEAAAEYAEEAAGSAIKVKNMTVSSETLPAGSEATVTKTETETAFNLEFGLPAGPKGDKGDKGDFGPEGPIGPQGEKGDTGDEGPQGPQGVKGDTGDTGQRGSNILRVTSALEYYNTPIGGFTPNRRIATNIVKTQAQVDEVYVHDVIWRSQVMYNVGYVDSDYVYTGAGVNLQGAKGDTGDTGPTGPQGPAGPQGPQGDDYVLTAQDKSDIADIVISELPTWTGGAY